MFGADGWTISDNQIFGNFKWGVGAVLRPVQRGRRRGQQQQPVRSTTRWAAAAPTRTRTTSSTTAPGRATASPATRARPSTTSEATTPRCLYPACPAPAPPASGTGPAPGDAGQVFGDLASYVTSDPPETQECSWAKHAHPPFKDYKPHRRSGPRAVPMRQGRRRSRSAACSRSRLPRHRQRRGRPQVEDQERQGPRRLLLADQGQGQEGHKVKWAWGERQHRLPQRHPEEGPEGREERNFRSIAGAIGINFAPKFRSTGTYKFYCTIHPDVMKMNVVVKK